MDTTVADGSDLVKTYKVKAGDTLSGIASKFGVSTMSVWWANDLEDKADLKQGQELRIPPVSGLIVEVKATDTLESLAARHDVEPAEIIELNGLDDPNLVVGQVLVVPGAKGKPIATPKPTPRPGHQLGRWQSGWRWQLRWRRRRDEPSAQDLLRWQLRLARPGRHHQPVLPLRPLRPGHRRRHR